MAESSAQKPTFRERIRQWTRPPRRLSFTRSGKFFVLMTLAIGFGAINTGNNLLFLLLGMMLSLIIASGILSEAVIRKLDASRSAPKRMFASTPAAGGFRVKNPKSYASLSVEISERNPIAVEGPLAGRELGPNRVPWWKFWTSTSTDGEFEAVVASSYRMRIEADDDIELDARYRFPRRGAYQMTGLNLTTRFPFSFFEKVRELDDEEELVVFPRPADADEWLTTVSARFGDVSQNERGMGEEYFGLREYRPGEDKRLIHWKSSARRGETVVRETESQEQRSVEIMLMHWTGVPAQQRHQVEAQFEQDLERVVGLILRLVSGGYRVGLRTRDGRVPLGQDAAGVDRMLAQLATVELLDGNQTFQSVPDLAEQPGRILIGPAQAVARAQISADVVLPMDGESTPRPTDKAA
ncbi:MAG: DUF58 domain-containing protein [Myxococcota bacterium]